MYKQEAEDLYDTKFRVGDLCECIREVTATISYPTDGEHNKELGIINVGTILELSHLSASEVVFYTDNCCYGVEIGSFKTSFKCVSETTIDATLVCEGQRWECKKACKITYRTLMLVQRNRKWVEAINEHEVRCGEIFTIKEPYDTDDPNLIHFYHPSETPAYYQLSSKIFKDCFEQIKGEKR